MDKISDIVPVTKDVIDETEAIWANLLKLVEKYKLGIFADKDDSNRIIVVGVRCNDGNWQSFHGGPIGRSFLPLPIRSADVASLDAYLHNEEQRTRENYIRNLRLEKQKRLVAVLPKFEEER